MKLKELKEIFISYKINKVKIENSQIINSNNKNNKLNSNELQDATTYVKIVENILKNLDKDDQYIIIKIYLENKEWNELHFSYSTIYKKIRKANKAFMTFWGY